MPQAVTVRVFDSCLDLSRAAADRVVRLAAEAIERRGRFVVALAGAATLRHTYERLADAPCRTAIPWADVHVCWVDERMVDPSAEASAYRLAYESLLKYVDVVADQVHPIPTTVGRAAAVASAYEQTLREVFSSTEGQVPSFDAILLGMEADGTVASLCRGSSVLDERRRLVATSSGTTGDVARIMITPPVIEHARDVILVAGEPETAGAVRAALDGPHDPRSCPAHVLRAARGTVTWFVSHPDKEFTRCT